MARTLWGKARSDLETTQWSRVMNAGQDDSREALSELCQAYWQPIYWFVRRRGFTAEQAEDLTQTFLASLLAPGALAQVDPQRGRFRDWLRAAVANFLSSEVHLRRARKRNDHARFTLDVAAAEEGLRRESLAELPPDQLFDRRWALSVTTRAFARVREDYVREGKADLFAQLEGALAGEAPADNAQRYSRQRMAKAIQERYRRYLREEIAETVPRGDEVDDEIRLLLDALG
jgi:RNA polymerase sigma-70 factor (ECF subfamily)